MTISKVLEREPPNMTKSPWKHETRHSTPALSQWFLMFLDGYNYLIFKFLSLIKFLVAVVET